MALVYSTGTVTATNGSGTLTFVGAFLTPSVAKEGNEIFIDGSFIGTLASVNYSAQTAVVAPVYSGATGSGKTYAIRSVTPMQVTASEVLNTTRTLIDDISVYDAKTTGFLYRLGPDTTTDADPGDRLMKMDSEVASSVTQMFLSKTDDKQRDVSPLLELLTPGSSLYVRSIDSMAYAAYTVLTYTDHTEYVTLSVEHVGSDGVLIENEPIVLAWNRNGATGATGANAGPIFTYSSTTTDADPGAGIFRLNGVPSSATQTFVDNLEQGGGDVSAFLQTFDDSTNPVKGTLVFRGITNPAAFAVYHVTGSVVDGTGYRKITLTHLSSGGTWTNGHQFALLFTQSGDTGPVVSVNGETGVVVLDKTDVGLGNVDNTSDLNKPISTATQTALDLKAPLASPTFTGTVSGITKTMVGLGNVDNTSDANKPISTATQTALDLKAPLASPALTGTPTAPTQSVSDDSTNIATTAYVKALIASLDLLAMKGAIDASTNPNYPAANAGDAYRISGAGKIGGASGVDVEIGDLIVAAADGLASDTQAAVGASWVVLQVNISGALLPSAIGTTVQGYDADLAAIAALAPSNDWIIQRKGGVWTASSPTTVKTDLALNNVPNTDIALDGTETIYTSASNSIGVAQKRKTLVANSATSIAFTLDAAATLTAGWTALATNIGDGDLTIGIDGGASFDNGETTIVITKGQSLALQSNGTTVRALLRGGGSGGGAALIEKFSFVGSGVAGPYPMGAAPASEQHVIAVVGGVPQDDFTISGSNITFGFVVETGVEVYGWVWLGSPDQMGIVPEYYYWVPTEGQTSFTGATALDPVTGLSKPVEAPLSDAACELWLGGVRLQMIEHWTRSGADFTLLYPAEAVEGRLYLKVTPTMGMADAVSIADFNEQKSMLSGFRNKIINGDFDIWQRGTTQTASGYGADDRWGNETFGGTFTCTRQTHALGQTDVPGNPTYYSKTVVVAGSTTTDYVRKTQKIESVKTLAGKQATITFYANADATKNIGIHFIQRFGTGGSPSTAVVGTVQYAVLNTSWQKIQIVVDVPSISGKTLGSNGDDCLDLVIWFDAGSATAAPGVGHQSGTFRIAHVSLVEGDASQEADPFSPRHIGQELELCQRYFCKSYSQGVNPGTATNNGAIDQGFPVAGTGQVNVPVQWPVLMRSAPTIVLYDLAGTSGAVFRGANGKTSAFFSFNSDRGAACAITDATSSPEVAFHYTASAEL